jgi:hypothetical protein
VSKIVTLPDVGELADLYRERRETREDILWGALMVCHDCPHRIIEHDEVAFRCSRCSCDQSQRGLGARADERLRILGRAIDLWSPADDSAGDRHTALAARDGCGGSDHRRRWP